MYIVTKNSIHHRPARSHDRCPKGPGAENSAPARSG